MSPEANTAELAVALLSLAAKLPETDDRATIRRAADCLATGHFPPSPTFAVECKANFADLASKPLPDLVIMGDDPDALVPIAAAPEGAPPGIRHGFQPAFGTPTNPAEAVAMLASWGDPSVATFSDRKAKLAAELLAPLLPSMLPTVAIVLAELRRATKKFPTWPTDPLHAVAVLNEEAGELTRAVLQLTYEPGKSSLQGVRDEAAQVGAMALRFLASMDRYDFDPSIEHHQEALHG